MHETINERVSVITVFDRRSGTKPVRIQWHERVYQVKKIGYYHKTREGRALIHIFSVLTDSLAMRLEFNTETLLWTLAEVSDGLAT